MEPRNVIVWILLVVLVILAMSAGAQAQELREVPASEILEKIQAGEDVNYTNVRVTGELDLSEIYLETVPNPRPPWQIEKGGLKEELEVVESKIKIVNSVFENNVDFSSTQFEKHLNFKDTKFLGRTEFIDVTFSGVAYFGNTNFSGVAHFAGATFIGDANFAGANFGGVAYFAAEPVYYYPAIFGSDADFAGANFSGDTYFSDVTFSGDAHFDDTNFSGDAIFNSTEFNNVVFSNTTFSEVSLHGIDFKSMEVEWSSLKDVLVFDGPTYIKLIKNFREMEQFTDADNAYYQYRRQSRANKEGLLPKLGDIFMCHLCGYGVRPWNAPFWGMIIICIFGFVYMPLNVWPFTFFDLLRESGIKRLKENDEEEYLFSWGDVPGKDNERLIRYLGSNFSSDQAENVEIRKSDDGKTIYTHNDDESAKIMIDENEEKATLNISDHEPLHLKVKKEGGELNIYKESKEGISFWDAFYFSVVTFTTLGYGDWYPKDRYRKFVMIEGLTGWIVLALFLVTLANVMIRP